MIEVLITKFWSFQKTKPGRAWRDKLGGASTETKMIESYYYAKFRIS